MRKYIALILILLLLPNVSMAKDVTLLISGAEEKIDSFKKDDIHYVSFSEIVELVGGTLDWKSLGQTIQFVEDTNRFEFVIGSPYFKRNNSLLNMTYPSVYKKGKLFLPAETFIRFWDEVIFQKVVWDKTNKTIRINSEYFNVTDISCTNKANGLLLEVFLTSALAYDIFVTEGNWINISIRNGRLNRSQIQSRMNSKYMYKLKTHQQNSTGQISIRLKRKINKWHHKLQNNPSRIQISIADTDFEMDPNDSQTTIGPDKKIDIIVIDAGHGGNDYGAVGQKNIREKDVSLAIAKELAKLIRKDKQFKVIMTRDRDKTMTLEERAKIANQSACDLFISIHANASPKTHVRGWNVFFLAQAKNDSARSVAQFENSAFLRDQEPESSTETTPMIDFNDPILGIINEMIMTEFQTESHDFAVMVDREFRKNLQIPARGVDQAGFFVLNKVYAPSVLLETGFISNKREEKLLKSKKYQKEVAKSVYKAIKRFKSKYESN
ncbi:MAG TPA: hypothetical protein ENH23_05980 [candidate division Zixibacteria bacterium]|nr:hypothetical protein [candidate division Zixibacteria bacterium]